MSEITVSYEGQLRCSAVHAESGTVVVTDAPKESHGNESSFSPSELLSVALGSCILSMMGLTARTLGVELSGATASVTKEMANTPRRITKISVQVRVPAGVPEDARQRLEAAAHCCPVHAVLNLDVPMRFIWGNASCERVGDEAQRGDVLL